MSEKNLSSISDSEWEVMRIVWTLGETNTKQILNELQAKKDWTDSTIKTLIRRLVQKGWLNAKQDGRRYIYTATVNQTDMMYNEANNLLNRMCDMHKGEVILKLLEDSPVSKGDLIKMKKEISQKEKEAPEMVPCNCLKTGSTICQEETRMNGSQIITLIIGVILIGFIIWWFFGKHKEAAGTSTIVNDEQTATIVVNGGYSPSTVILKKGVPAQVNFDMRDSTACLSHVVFEQLGVNEDLTKQKITTVNIPTDKAGTYNFACGMDMFHGKVIVK